MPDVDFSSFSVISPPRTTVLRFATVTLVSSRIPYLGLAFKSTKTTKSRKELIIFIQPVVVEGNDETAAASDAEDSRTEVGLDAAELFPDVPVRETPAPKPAGKTDAVKASSKK